MCSAWDAKQQQCWASRMAGATVRSGDWSGPAYAEADTCNEETIRLAARLEGLALAPVYSGKGVAGLVGLARQGRFQTGRPVVWIHTGGSRDFRISIDDGALSGDGSTDTARRVQR
jgi:1-aminocyclopropane-1-carboxylate deaminase/D-cysteine desulfhydrase-like pyridoxal-dependent ACC family enzyme